jgi:hypothetical protein
VYWRDDLDSHLDHIAGRHTVGPAPREHVKVAPQAHGHANRATRPSLEVECGAVTGFGPRNR